MNEVLKNLIRCSKSKAINEQRANTAVDVLKKEGKWLTSEEIVNLQDEILKDVSFMFKNININSLRYKLLLYNVNKVLHKQVHVVVLINSFF